MIFLWEEVNQDIGSLLAPLTEEYPGKVEGAVFNLAQGLPKYLRILSYTKKHPPQVFIKLVPRDKASNEFEVARLGEAIAEHGVITPTARGYVEIYGGYIAFVYDWIEGHHPSGIGKEMPLIGKALAKFHKALRTEDVNFSISSKTESRLIKYERLALSSMFESRWKGTVDEDFVRRMKASYLDGLEAIRKRRAPCHGDLHPGNILILKTGNVAFIDLEDALHMSVWPGFDLAKVVERLVFFSDSLINKPAQTEMIKDLLNAYSTEYESHSVINDIFDIKSLSLAMLWHLGLSVLVLTERYSPSSDICKREIHKFRKIESSISNYANQKSACL